MRGQGTIRKRGGGRDHGNRCVTHPHLVPFINWHIHSPPPSHMCLGLTCSSPLCSGFLADRINLRIFLTVGMLGTVDMCPMVCAGWVEPPHSWNAWYSRYMLGVVLVWVWFPGHIRSSLSVGVACNVSLNCINSTFLLL